MPKATPLQVRRKGTAMVQHYESHPNVRRFHGYTFDPTQGEEFEHPETKQMVRSGGFVPHDKTIEVPNTVDYRRAVRDGDLWPADQATAQICGVPFDPTFGGSEADFSEEKTWEGTGEPMTGIPAAADGVMRTHELDGKPVPASASTSSATQAAPTVQEH